jgi:hypothetical protein
MELATGFLPTACLQRYNRHWSLTRPVEFDVNDGRIDSNKMLSFLDIDQVSSPPMFICTVLHKFFGCSPSFVFPCDTVPPFNCYILPKLAGILLASSYPLLRTLFQKPVPRNPYNIDAAKFILRSFPIFG